MAAYDAEPAPQGSRGGAHPPTLGRVDRSPLALSTGPRDDGRAQSDDDDEEDEDDEDEPLEEDAPAVAVDAEEELLSEEVVDDEPEPERLSVR